MDLVVARLAEDDLLVVPHIQAAEVVKELQVECCWHMDMELLVVNGDNHLVVHLYVNERGRHKIDVRYLTL